MIAGFLGGCVFYILKRPLPPIIIAVFLATGISSLAYGFLGGIKGATFIIGPLKFTGPIAVLIGSSWFINSHLERQTKYILSRDFTPGVNTWFAIDKSKGIPIKVKMEWIEDSIERPPLNVFVNNQLDMKHGDSGFLVTSKVNPEFILGYLSIQDLKEINLFNTIRKQLVRFIVTDHLPPNTPGVDLDPIPFRLSTRKYGGEYSRYILTDKTNNVLHESSIYGRQTEIVKLQGKYYLIGVVEVNHNPREVEKIYAKFAVGEIIVDIQP